MRRIMIVAAYDGTDFCGWQIQQNGRTVQQEIEKALEVLHKHPVRLYGSGRTDSGVHAAGQAAHFDTDIDSLPAERFCLALGRQLPPDVQVISSCEVSDDFHARFSAVARSYRYVIRTIEATTPFNQRFSTGVRRLPAVSLLNEYARQIIGIHDFTTFSAVGDVSESKVRHIMQAGWHAEGDALVFTITGNAFLWRMVRSLIGTMLDLHDAGAPAERMSELLSRRDRLSAGTTAPARGLRLERVAYE